MFVLFDWAFGILFFFEATVKIGVFRVAYFKDGWSWLDLLCVLTFLIDKAASALLPVDPRILRLLRLFRLLRLVRLLRTLESLDVLYIMTTAMKGMSRVLFWAVILLSVMLVSLALVLTQVLHASYFDEGVVPDPLQIVQRQKMYQYFGSFTRCLMSMFEITLANWPPVTRLLAEEVHEVFFMFCIMHKLTIGFAVLGVINGVILQETFKVAATDDMIMVRQKKRAGMMMKKKMMILFEALDFNNNGLLDQSEFEAIGDIPEVKTWLSSMDVETDDLSLLFQLIDDDNSGVVSIDELVSRIPRIKGPSRGMDMLSLTKKLKESGHFEGHDRFQASRKEARMADGTDGADI